jgi:hypothetical protein
LIRAVQAVYEGAPRGSLLRLTMLGLLRTRVDDGTARPGSAQTLATLQGTATRAARIQNCHLHSLLRCAISRSADALRQPDGIFGRRGYFAASCRSCLTAWLNRLSPTSASERHLGRLEASIRRLR